MSTSVSKSVNESRELTKLAINAHKQFKKKHYNRWKEGQTDLVQQILKSPIPDYGDLKVIITQ